MTNLWSLHFTTPKILRPSGAVSGGNLQAEVGEMHTLLDYFADTVNLPSKQVTTGSFRSVGSAVRYATASTFSQFSVNFKVPASQKTRIFFERWISLMANDANQYTEFYDDYISGFSREMDVSLKNNHEIFKEASDQILNDSSHSFYRNDQAANVSRIIYRILSSRGSVYDL